MKVRQFTNFNFDASKQASFDVAQVDNDNVTLPNLHGAHEYIYASKSIHISLAFYFIYLSSYLCIYLYIHSFIHSPQFVRLLISA